jgi:preprotein translocase subunit YajC
MGSQPIASSPYTLAQIVPVAVLLVIMAVLFWWIVGRPEKRRQRDHLELVANLKVGDRIVTAGGMHGTVVAVHQRTVEIEVAPKTVLTFDKYAVRKRQ